jgi:hypothetical protein
MPEVKPSDIYVGVVELFSVLLPGAFLEAAIIRVLFPIIHNPFAPLLETAETQWVAFAFAAYALGAFVFPVASLLDGKYYDPYRQRRWPRADDHAYQLATQLRREFFDQSPEDDADIPMNTFAWAKSMLTLKAAAAFADVQRYEAESKFFRSLVIVLPAGAVFLALAWWKQPTLAVSALVASLLMARLSFHRYAERRQKSTEWAYRYVITLLGAGDGPAPPPPPASPSVTAAAPAAKPRARSAAPPAGKRPGRKVR